VHADGFRVVTRPAPAQELHLDLPVVDTFDFDAPNVTFSMQQATVLTGDLVSLGELGVSRISDPFSDSPVRIGLGYTLISTFDALMTFVAFPLSPSWTHEEGHHAVLSAIGVHSSNPFTFQQPVALPLLDPVPIDVTQNTVAGIKAANPVQCVHVGISGINNAYLLAYQLEDNVFFRGQPTASFLPAMMYFANTTYMGICAQGTTFGDCNLWVDGLYHPALPPLGSAGAAAPGAIEHGYLQTQFYLSLLNLLDPLAYTVRAFEVPTATQPVRFNLAVRHIPTPFGYEIRGDVFFRRGDFGMRLEIQNAFNDGHYFPGLAAVLAPIEAGPLHLSGRSSVWAQPSGLSFTTGSAMVGIDEVLRLGLPLAQGRVLPYLEGEGKTAGWVLGNPFLGPSVTVRSGVELNVF